MTVSRTSHRPGTHDAGPQAQRRHRDRRREQDRPRRRALARRPRRRRPAAGRDQDDQRPLRRRDHRRARPAVDPDRRRADRRGAAVLAARRAAARRLHRQGGPRPGRRLVQPVRRARPRRGPDRRRDGRASSRTTPASSTSPSTPTADRRFEYFGLRTVYDRYLLRHPTQPARDRDAAVLPAARRLRAVAHAGRGDRLLPADVVAGLPAELARRCSTPARGTPRCRPATCSTRPRDELDSIYDRYQQVARLSKFAGGIGIAWSRVRSRGSLIRGTNGQSQRHRAVAADARRVGRRGQPGRPAQGRGLRLPRAVARRHRGVPRAARQHRRGRPAHAQPQPRQLDPGRVHAPRRGRRRCGRCSTRTRCRSCPTCGARRSTRPTARPRPSGRYVRQVKARDLYGRMMRTLAQTGNGWMTFKDAANRTVQPDRRVPGQRRAPVQPVHRDHRGHAATPRPPCATSARSTSAQHRDAPTAAGSTGTKLRDDRAHRGAVPRPRDRHQLLPDASEAAASNPRWRPVGPRASWACRTCSSSCGCRSTRAEARELSTRIAEEIYLTALEASADARRAARRPPGLRRDPRGRGATCSSTCGASTPTQTERWAALRERDRRDRPAQLAADRDRADRDDRLDRRLLRVHRAAGVQPVQARDAVGRVPAGQPHLVRELKALGLWTDDDPRRRSSGPRARCRASTALPDDVRALYRTAWELPQRR